ncbi:hypothetical protein EQG63_11500 [Flavobacterium amnicola]|uniref:Right-handed parallel beta-helix repeat-containing protein n=1 Tax=Flavobacterium amnicola TaxID=2506422 RepID=A0A4Q1K1H9_9FLAO|nr:hypothetical protein [Flavobacterium amnicola]RXR16244.1 hypothetical protein EQG63_11500 [Flavobacterium amnicola]
MRIYFSLIIIILTTLTSCRKDFDTVPSTGNLQFSKTTVYLDTVFTGIASSTYMLKVYNRSDKDISIPSIALGKGASSKYRLMVDGRSDNNGKLFTNVELLAKDSMFVFIEQTADIIDANPTDLLYTDEILFDSGAYQQKVNLVTLIQDAIFLYPDRTPISGGGYSYENLQLDDTDPESKIYGFELSGGELHFTKDKPYVIYGYAGVKSGDVLTIDPGARVHFHDQSGIFVKNGGSIQVNGTISTTESLENEVIFEGDRLEPSFSETPGQWGIIYLAEGSTNNAFNHATIKNATVGIFVDNQDATTVQIKNTQIYNASNYGIIARKGKINGENIVINKCGQSSLACILGGSYDFTHCTFANYWSGSRQSPAVYLDNTYKQGDALFVSPLVQANFTNCIIYGLGNIELGLKRDSDTSIAFNYNINHCLIKFYDPSGQLNTNPLYTPFLNDNSNLIATNINSRDPKFKNSVKNNLRIGLTSAAKAKGDPAFIIAQDADGKTRTSPPDLGAYEHLNE